MARMRSCSTPHFSRPHYWKALSMALVLSVSAHASTGKSLATASTDTTPETENTTTETTLPEQPTDAQKAEPEGLEAESQKAFPKVAIIIDDLGYGLRQAQILADIPFPLTFAIIPFTPYGSKVAEIGFNNDKEIMLHAPMETLGRQWEPGLTAAMSEGEVASTLDNMLADIPHVAGVNNHGGSRFTQDKPRMERLMQTLANHGLYFVDSRTVASDAARDAAAKNSVPFDSRDVFLDNNKDTELIEQQLEKLLKIASTRGQAVGIGHPYPETIAVLSETLPKFQNMGVEIVPASRLVKTYPSQIAEDIRLTPSPSMTPATLERKKSDTTITHWGKKKRQNPTQN